MGDGRHTGCWNDARDRTGVFYRKDKTSLTKMVWTDTMMYVQLATVVPFDCDWHVRTQMHGTRERERARGKEKRQ